MATRRGSRSSGKSSEGRGQYRGAAGRERVEKELEEQKRRQEQRKAQQGQPFRFWMGEGEQREVVICDEAPDFFMYEHNLKDKKTNRWNIHCGCVKEHDNCPACEEVGDSSYNMYLTVIDFKEFEDSRGNTHEFSRKLFVVKSGQQKKFLRKFEKEGTLRGAVFTLSRDTKKDPVIGNDIEFEELMDEEELLTYEREYQDKDGKTHVEKCHEPFDYEELFPEPDVDDILALVGGEPSPGSRASDGVSRRSRRNRDDDDEDEGKSSRSSRRSSRKRDEDEEEEDKPSRSSRRSRRGKDEDEEDSRPSRSSRRSKRDDDDEPWDDDDAGEDDGEEEGKRPSRRSKRGSRR